MCAFVNNLKYNVKQNGKIKVREQLLSPKSAVITFDKFLLKKGREGQEKKENFLIL